MFTKRENLEDKILDLSNLSDKLHFELKYIREYVIFTQDALIEKNKILEAKMYSDTTSEPDNESIIQQFYDTQKKTLFSHYHHSTIVLIYSILENSLSSVCDEISKSVSPDFSHNDLYSKGLVNKLMSYIRLTSRVDLLDINQEFNDIEKFRKLRNMIVHQSSGFSGDDKKINNDIKLISSCFPEILISKEDLKFYIMENSVILKFINLVNTFMTKIINHIQSLTYQIKSGTMSEPISDSDIPF